MYSVKASGCFDRGLAGWKGGWWWWIRRRRRRRRRGNYSKTRLDWGKESEFLKRKFVISFGGGREPCSRRFPINHKRHFPSRGLVAPYQMAVFIAFSIKSTATVFPAR
jgi:hypothetical protein